MANLHQLPCSSCNAIISVSPRQAGQSIQCSQCGAEVTAPKLGELKRLPTVEVQQTPEKRKMSALGKGMFTAGLALMVLLGGAGVGLYKYAHSLHTNVDVEGNLDDVREQLNAASDQQIYAMASELARSQGLGEFAEPVFLKKNKQGAILTYFAYGLLAAGGLGFLLMLGSFVMK